MTSDWLGDTAVLRLRELGYSVPPQGPADAKYAAHQRVDSSIYIAGQLPYVDGGLPAQGLLGGHVDIPHTQELARLTAINALAVSALAVGDLDRVRVVQMLVFVASAAGFADQSTVADGASELLLTVLGDNGRHARTAIGVAGLPRNSPVEIQLVCTEAAAA